MLIRCARLADRTMSREARARCFIRERQDGTSMHSNHNFAIAEVLLLAQMCLFGIDRYGVADARRRSW